MPKSIDSAISLLFGTKKQIQSAILNISIASVITQKNIMYPPKTVTDLSDEAMLSASTEDIL